MPSNGFHLLSNAYRFASADGEEEYQRHQQQPSNRHPSSMDDPTPGKFPQLIHLGLGVGSGGNCCPSQSDPMDNRQAMRKRCSAVAVAAEPVTVASAAEAAEAVAVPAVAPVVAVAALPYRPDESIRLNDST